MKAWTWARGDWRLTLRQRANGRYELRLERRGCLVVSREFLDILAASDAAYDLADLGGLVQQWKGAASA